MAVTAFVLIKVEWGKAREVAQSIRPIAGTRECHPATGSVDVICLAEADDLISPGGLVISEIQATSRVRETVTCWAI